MSSLLKLRRGSTVSHSTFTGEEGEITVDITKDTLVVHDGVTVGGHPLVKEVGGTISGGTISGGTDIDEGDIVTGGTLALRRDTTTQHSTFTGAAGEVTFDTDKNAIVTHDGVTVGGFVGGGYMPSGTGAVVRSVEEKLRESVSVFDYKHLVTDLGGVNENWQVAIQTAITNNDSIFFPSGVTYRITAPIVFSAYVTKRLHGEMSYSHYSGSGTSKILCAFSNSASAVFDGQSLQNNVSISNLVIDCAETNTPAIRPMYWKINAITVLRAKYGILAYTAAARISNCTVFGIADNSNTRYLNDGGVGIIAGSDVFVSNSSVEIGFQYGILITGTGAEVSNNYFDQCVIGIVVNGATQASISNNRMQYNWSAGIQIGYGAYTPPLGTVESPVTGCTISNCVAAFNGVAHGYDSLQNNPSAYAFVSDTGQKVNVIVSNCWLGEAYETTPITKYAIQLNRHVRTLLFSNCHLGHVATNSILNTVSSGMDLSLVNFDSCIFCDGPGLITGVESRSYYGVTLKYKQDFSANKALTTIEAASGVSIATSAGTGKKLKTYALNDENTLIDAIASDNSAQRVLQYDHANSKLLVNYKITLGNTLYSPTFTYGYGVPTSTEQGGSLYMRVAGGQSRGSSLFVNTDSATGWHALQPVALTSIAVKPDFIGDFAVVGGVGYMATGTLSTADWKQITN